MFPPADATEATDTRDAATLAQEVAVFAAAVRAHLDDLPPDDVEDLVDGLEADLMERAEDSGDPLGDPREYADELRSAAGLPPRDSRPASGEWFGGYKRLARNVAAWWRKERQNPTVAAVFDFLLALRPVWWLLRGWAVFTLLVMLNSLTPLPTDLVGWVFLLAAVVASVQWGRGRWLPRRWLRGVKVAVSVVAILALPWLIGAASSKAANTAAYVYETQEIAPQELSANGMPVTNVFPYDCTGQPISGVQLFDQNGDPLAVGGAGGEGWITGADPEGVEFPIVPNPAANADSGWNVFPLFQGEFSQDYSRVIPSTVEEPTPPFAAVQPLADPVDTCAPADGSGAESTDASGDPSGDPSDGPSSTPSPAPSGGSESAPSAD